MAERGNAMAAGEVGKGLLTGLDTVEKVADVKLKLLERSASLVADVCGPKLGRLRSAGAGDAASGLAAIGELGHGVFRADGPVAGDRETRTGNRERAFRAVKNEG